MNKRYLNLSLLVLCFGIFLSACQSKSDKLDMNNQLTHHVFFWLKNAGSVEDRNKLIRGLRTLEKIEVINAAHIGTPAGTESRDVVDHSYDVSLLLFFNNNTDQKIYQDHPIHLEFVENNKDLWEKVVVYDTQPQ